MRKPYIVRATASSVPGRCWPYPANYFPRKVHYLAQAKRIAKMAIKVGATMARIEFPNGAELDFRPEGTDPCLQSQQ